MKVLIPVDGSECAMRAVEFVIHKMRPSCGERLELKLLTVHPPIPYPRAVAVIGHERAQEYYEEEGKAALQPARERLDRDGITYQAQMRVGDPGETIARYASEVGADQIVMGTHGRSSVGRLLMGSVATKVVQLAQVPVLLVK
ncbi:MAG: universal stress protein [Rhodospirillaceae bacterium]